MSTLLDDIAAATKGKSFKTYKYGFDGIDVPRFDYDDHRHQITWESYGETAYITKPKDMKPLADAYLQGPPLFSYFLDGSRKAYKVDDMAYQNRVYPIIAGQVGVGCCTREDMEMKPLYCGSVPMFERQLVISLPKKAKASDWDDDELAFEHLRKKINGRPELSGRGISFSKILSYSTKVEIGDKIENKGIATVQNHMIEREKYMVAELVRRGCLLPSKYLMKDGSLEYHRSHTPRDCRLDSRREEPPQPLHCSRLRRNPYRTLRILRLLSPPFSGKDSIHPLPYQYQQPQSA